MESPHKHKNQHVCVCVCVCVFWRMNSCSAAVWVSGEAADAEDPADHVSHTAENCCSSSSFTRASIKPSSLKNECRITGLFSE